MKINGFSLGVGLINFLAIIVLIIASIWMPFPLWTILILLNVGGVVFNFHCAFKDS